MFVHISLYVNERQIKNENKTLVLTEICIINNQTVLNKYKTI